MYKSIDDVPLHFKFKIKNNDSLYTLDRSTGSNIVIFMTEDVMCGIVYDDLELLSILNNNDIEILEKYL